MTEATPYRILLYYKYVHIENPSEFAEQHLAFCKSLGLLGRILVAEEGINGTVSGAVEQTEAYMNAMHDDPRFADMGFKVDSTNEAAFHKMFVRVKKEIVNFSLDDDVNPRETTGTYLEPMEFYEALQQDDVVVIDARNDYEFDIGHFRSAIRPDVQTFREFPEWVRENLSQFKDKKILTYCTGGIRCEKFSGFLIKEGFEDVSQLHGGIVTYGKDPEVQGRLFDGKCYVFDERIAVPVNRTDDDVIVGRCYHCGNPADRYINCEYPNCHRQHICCEVCEEAAQGFCSPACAENMLCS
jgi:UPF0176 protein